MKQLSSQINLKPYFADKLNSSHDYDVRCLHLKSAADFDGIIQYRIDSTKHGHVLQAWHEDRLCIFRLVQDEELPAELMAMWPNVSWELDAKSHLELLSAYETFESFKVPITLISTSELKLKTWEALLRIPYGQVCTYAQLAAAIDHPQAVRAVGSANAANLVHWLVPCHRVVKSDGRPGEYTSLMKKMIILVAELDLPTEDTLFSRSV